MVWDNLKKPFFVLAPLDDVTDVVFRQMVAEVAQLGEPRPAGRAAKPDLFFTEFTNCDALFSKGREATLPRLRFTEQQQPIIAQLWGVTPENYFKTAQLVAELGFDGIDINMGCPDKNVRKAGACSALIDNRPLAAEILAATKEGAPDLPVSVKTRLGIRGIQTDDWIGWLLQQDLAAITIHGRTVLEMSAVPAHWDEIGRAVQLRNEVAPKTYIVGNGDVMSLAEAHEKVKDYGVDGVMIGRGIFKNLWFFDPTSSRFAGLRGAGSESGMPVEARLKALEKHIRLFLDTWGGSKNPATMKKFLKMYVSDFPGAAALREELMNQPTLEVLLERLGAESAK
jgi:tRNA-dihydrouridine synthase